MLAGCAAPRLGPGRSASTRRGPAPAAVRFEPARLLAAVGISGARRPVDLAVRRRAPFADELREPFANLLLHVLPGRELRGELLHAEPAAARLREHLGQLVQFDLHENLFSARSAVRNCTSRASIGAVTDLPERRPGAPPGPLVSRQHAPPATACQFFFPSSDELAPLPSPSAQ